MKKQAFMLALAILISGVFAIPKSAFTRDDGRYDQSRLQDAGIWMAIPIRSPRINAIARVWKRETKTAIRPDWMWIAMGMFALAIGTTSAAGCVGTGSNGITEPRGHGGRRIDTAGAKVCVWR
jgi:hypothetical protein